MKSLSWDSSKELQRLPSFGSLRRILSGDVVCVVVSTFREYDTLESIPDVTSSVPTFLNRLCGQYAIVFNADHSYDSGYSTAHIFYDMYNNKNLLGPIRPDFNYMYFM